MGLTLLELREEIRAGLGNRTELASSTTRIDRWLNMGQKRMVRRNRFKELNTTIEHSPQFNNDPSVDKFILYSDLEIPNPRAIVSIVRVESDNSAKLIYVPFRLWDRRLPNTEQYGADRPSHYTTYNNKIELWRIPGAAYTYRIRMSRWPLDLTGDAQESDLEDKDDALIAVSLYYAYLSLGNNEKAAGHLGTYNLIMGDARIEDYDEPDYDAVEPNRASGGASGQYWNDPFSRSTPR